MLRTIAAAAGAAAVLLTAGSPAHGCNSLPQPVRFAPGSDRPLASDLWRLDDQASFREAFGPGARIRLTAYSDRVGGGWANLRLSRRRAEAVRDALIRLGTPANRIDILNRGEANLPKPTPDEQAEDANRVVIVTVFAEAQLKRENPVSGCKGYNMGG